MKKIHTFFIPLILFLTLLTTSSSQCSFNSQSIKGASNLNHYDCESGISLDNLLMSKRTDYTKEIDGAIDKLNDNNDSYINRALRITEKGEILNPYISGWLISYIVDKEAELKEKISVLINQGFSTKSTYLLDGQSLSPLEVALEKKQYDICSLLTVLTSVRISINKNVEFIKNTKEFNSINREEFEKNRFSKKVGKSYGKYKKKCKNSGKPVLPYNYFSYIFLYKETFNIDRESDWMKFPVDPKSNHAKKIDPCWEEWRDGIEEVMKENNNGYHFDENQNFFYGIHSDVKLNQLKNIKDAPFKVSRDKNKEVLKYRTRGRVLTLKSIPPRELNLIKGYLRRINPNYIIRDINNIVYLFFDKEAPCLLPMTIVEEEGSYLSWGFNFEIEDIEAYPFIPFLEEDSKTTIKHKKEFNLKIDALNNFIDRNLLESDVIDLIAYLFRIDLIVSKSPLLKIPEETHLLYQDFFTFYRENYMNKINHISFTKEFEKLLLGVLKMRYPFLTDSQIYETLEKLFNKGYLHHKSAILPRQNIFYKIKK